MKNLMSDLELMEKEAEKVEMYARIWRSYFFAYCHHLAKFFLEKEIAYSDVDCPVPNSTITRVMYIIVNYSDEIDYRLKRDAYGEAIMYLIEDYNLLNATKIPDELQGKPGLLFSDYFNQVGLQIMQNNEIADQFLNYDSKIVEFSKTHISWIIKDVKDDVNNWSVFNVDPSLAYWCDLPEADYEYLHRSAK